MDLSAAVVETLNCVPKDLNQDETGTKTHSCGSMSVNNGVEGNNVPPLERVAIFKTYGEDW